MNKLLRVSFLALAAVLLTACSGEKPPFNSIDITGADYARDFVLTDHDGQSRTLKDFRGQVVVMFFGYTQCPDVCPTTMSELATIKQSLGADGDKVRGVFVTVDPERDTPEILKAYMTIFGPDFVALRADTPEQLTALAKDYKVYYKKVAGKMPGNYTMDHSAGLYIYDPQGRLRLYARYGQGVEALAADIRQLLK